MAPRGFVPLDFHWLTVQFAPLIFPDNSASPRQPDSRIIGMGEGIVHQGLRWLEKLCNFPNLDCEYARKHVQITVGRALFFLLVASTITDFISTCHRAHFTFSSVGAPVHLSHIVEESCSCIAITAWHHLTLE